MKILHMGSPWHVGQGTDINARTDYWLPRSGDFTVQTTLPSRSAPRWLISLSPEVTGIWTSSLSCSEPRISWLFYKFHISPRSLKILFVGTTPGTVNTPRKLDIGLHARSGKPPSPYPRAKMPTNGHHYGHFSSLRRSVSLFGKSIEVGFPLLSS